MRDLTLFKKLTQTVCVTLLCGSLFLSGCSRTASGDPPVKREGKSQKPESSADAPEPKEDASEAGAADSTDAILAHLIGDAGFRERVWYDAGIADGDTEESILQKLAQCESLTLSEPPYGESLHSLAALSLMPNLRELTIDISQWDDSRIEDFTPIARLSHLETLSVLYDTGEEIDLSFLSEMKTVRELYLPYCRLRDATFLENMSQLQRLSLYETPVEDLAILEHLPELVELTISGNAGAAHIEAVKTLTKMQNLGLQDCGITEIGFLSGLTELQGLNLNDNSISDLTPLAGLTKLERLGASRNQISDISMLSGLTNLYDLALDGNRISDISALSGLTRLNQAGLSDNRITDLSPLADKEELMYAAVFGNPCTDIRPVLDVPLLYCMDPGVTEEEAAFAGSWMWDHHPEAENYECIDYVEGDLNTDGRADIAFVMEGTFHDGRFEDADGRAYEGCRRLYILLQQADGSWQELAETPEIRDRDSGGMRGDPYMGIFMGEGCLTIKTSWGSSTGATDMETYVLQSGTLTQVMIISAGDCNFSYGYDVRVTETAYGSWYRYAIAMDGYRMVRVDLANSLYPSQPAFPEIDLYDMSYYIYKEKRDTAQSSADALDLFRDAMAQTAAKAALTYPAWQKENYELLFGIELPDYYYTVPGTETSGEPSDGAQTSWQGDYFFYNGLTEQYGQLYHSVCYVTEGGKDVWLIHDETGELTGPL